MSRWSRVPRPSCCSRYSRAGPTSWRHSVRAPHSKPTTGCRSSSPPPGRCTRRPKAMPSCARSLRARRPCGRGGENGACWCGRLDGARPRSVAGQSVRDGARKFSTSAGARQPITGRVARPDRCRSRSEPARRGNGISEGDRRAPNPTMSQSASSCLMPFRQLGTSRKRSPQAGKPRASIRRARSRWSSWRRYSPTSATPCSLRRSLTSWSTRFPAREEGHYYQAAALFLAGRATDAERSIRSTAQRESAPRERTEPARRYVRVGWKSRVCSWRRSPPRWNWILATPPCM